MKPTRPELVDNLGTSHGSALDFLAADHPLDAGLDIATGYVNLAGLRHLARATGNGRAVRLLIGAAPEFGVRLPTEVFRRNRGELDADRNFAGFPPSRNAERLAGVERWLARPEIEVRHYRREFLHGKAYIFGDRSALVTSANLTAAGLGRNLELGLVHYQPHVVGEALAWFEKLWRDSADFKGDLCGLLQAAPRAVTDPWLVFLRALFELYGEPGEKEGPPKKTSLADFQVDGYRRAIQILREHHGCIFADAVGTGKTEIGLACIEEYALRRGQRALVVAPAQLVEMWKTRTARAGMPAEVISYHQLAADEQLTAAGDAKRRRHLRNDKEAYRLIVADEGHAFRNPDTGWYRALSRLLGGARKDLLLLTATPVNNGLWDLYHLVMAFARHDRAFAKHRIRSLRRLFLRAGANERDPENLNPDLLFPLADLVSVRRDRRFIEQSYPNAVFPDGTPVRFPTPSLSTSRYDLDRAWPGLVAAITGAIDALRMARYRPSAWSRGGTESSRETALAALLQSAILKRFESCHDACRRTVKRIHEAHQVFLDAWEKGYVPSSEALRSAAAAELEEGGLAESLLDGLPDSERTPTSEFHPEYEREVARDRDLLRGILDRLEAINAGDDPKLAALVRLVAGSSSRKIIVFSGFADTIRYLDDHLPRRIGRRERIAVIGAETDPDERTKMLGRFCPKSVIGPEHQLEDPEVDLLLSNDVLSEGQNLQQAAAVISYDMPWNPQRVVQRYGRVIRLKSDHDRVFLTTMLPEPGELEPILNLEAAIRRKMFAASVYGMDSPVLEGGPDDIRTFADRLIGGDKGLLEEAPDGDPAQAFGGEGLRALLNRWLREEGKARLERLPWGTGAVFRQGPGVPSRGSPGVFFAFRTRRGDRYWRLVLRSGETRPESDAAILRRINPGPAPGLGRPEADLETAWRAATASVVEEHRALADSEDEEESLGPNQRWALDLLRDPEVALPDGAEAAAAALGVGRGAIVRRTLGDLRRRVARGELSPGEAAIRIVRLVEQEGLRPVDPPEPAEAITTDDLGVVCWLEVLPPGPEPR